MPLMKVQTNLAIDTDTIQRLLPELSANVADLLGKPERYVMVEVSANLAMLFAGSSEPCAYVELKSIGLPDSQTQHFSKQICTWLEKQLDISPERIYIEFADAPRKLWGWNGSTF